MVERLRIPSEALRATLDKRQLEEAPPSIRSETQRDRDRILYSSAFLRLGHVTQVASPELGHIFHSRLTHSLKVAQVARGLAQRFKTLAERGELEAGAARLVECLDEDATEAAALAHDLGHPPFGHLAEEVLQERSKHASFEGNAQSFRIVTSLALRSSVVPGSDATPVGLNLTRRTLNGILKYPWLRAEEPPLRAKKWGAYADGDRRAFDWARQGYGDGERTLEACLMDWADDVTYAVHDMDDFFRARLIPLEHLTAGDSPERERFLAHLRSFATTKREAGEPGSDPGKLAAAAVALFSEGPVSDIDFPFSGRTGERTGLRELGSQLIGTYISAPRLRDADGEEVKLEIEDAIVEQVLVLKQLTWFYVINRPSLSVIQRGQREIVKTLFGMYRKAVGEGDSHILPPLYAERIARVPGDAARERVIIDLIASMTEASAAEIYRERIGVSSGSVLAHAGGPA
ncbi:MAG TPA: dNTP triphosphohydrolase [Solirubrobacterales bacterium]|nr:dNTP triphosphohydrolase [Solirubrobacterales bacterium]